MRLLVIRRLIASAALLFTLGLPSVVLASTIWNAADKSTLISLGSWAGQSGLYAEQSSTASTYGAVRATTSSKHSGKYYFEVIVTHLSVTSCGSCQLFGVANGSETLTQYLGKTNNSIALQTNGGIYKNNVDISGAHTCSASNNGSVIGFAIDLTNNKFWCTPDGTNWSKCSACATGDPGTPATGIDMASVNDGVSVYPAWSAANVSSNVDSAILNVGNYGPFVFAIPTGYSGWDAAGTSLGPNNTGPGTWVSAGSGAYDSSGSTATLSGGNLTATGGGSNTTTIAIGNYTDAKYTGKLYFEVLWTTVTGSNKYVGITSIVFSGKSNSATVGAAGQDPAGWGLGFNTADGQGYLKSSAIYTAVGHLCTPANGTYEGIAVDLGAKKMWCTIDGTNWDNGDSPASNIGGMTIPTQVLDYGVVPAADVSTGGVAVLNLGATAFHYSVPASFLGWDSIAGASTSGGSMLLMGVGR